MDMVDLSNYISINTDIQRLLRMPKEKMDADPLIWESSTSMGFVEDMVFIKSYVTTFILYPENNAQPFYVGNVQIVPDIDIENIRTQNVYRKAIEANGDYVWHKIEGADELYLHSKGDNIVLAKEIFDLSKKKKYGFLVIGVEADRYAEICNKLLRNDKEGIVLLSHEGQVLMQTGDVDQGTMEQATTTGFLRDIESSGKNYAEYGNYYIFRNDPQQSDNVILYFVPKENWLDSLQTVRLLPFIVLFALLFCLWPLTVWASGTISKPLGRLYESMMKFKGGDFSQQAPVSSRDEIGELTECFNTMVCDIKDLIDKNYIMVLHERESELNALQAQINPHFLYNTLDSLYWVAFNSEQKELSDDILALSRLFQLVLSQGKSDIPLSTEVELVSHYLHIQKMRFGKKLNYNISVDKSILQYTIPKLILQPFVENAIVHGLECQEETGEIEIRGRLDKTHIVLSVEDNGAGMSEEQLSKLSTPQDEPRYSSQRIGRYAIYNVNERLTLKYGEGYSLDIQSEIGCGTKVTIRIPVLERQSDD